MGSHIRGECGESVHPPSLAMYHVQIFDVPFLIIFDGVHMKM